jgi:hypothetical protein
MTSYIQTPCSPETGLDEMADALRRAGWTVQKPLSRGAKIAGAVFVAASLLFLGYVAYIVHGLMQLGPIAHYHMFG